MIRFTKDQMQKGGVIAGFLIVLGGIMFYELSDNGAPNPAAVAPPVVVTAPSAAKTSTGKEPVMAMPTGNVAGAAAKKLTGSSAQLDPTLRMDAMLVTEALVYSGSGRNIFSANSAPVVAIPKPIASVRTASKTPVVTGPPPPPPGPPPPPPIDLKFFGTATGSNGKRQAFLLHGDDVFIAIDGEIVQRRYKVITVSVNSILVEDLANSNRQSLPLIAH